MLLEAREQITFMSATPTISTTASLSATGTYPACMPGDLLVLAAANCGAYIYTSSLTNWTFVNTQKDTAGDVGLGVYYRIATGTESGTFTIGQGASQGTTNTAQMTVILRYAMGQGLRSSAFAIAPSSGTTATATSPAAPTLTGITATDLVIHIYAFGNGTSGSTTYTVSVPAGSGGWATRYQGKNTNTSTFAPSLLLLDKVAASDVPSTTSTVTGGWSLMSVGLINSAQPQDLIEQNFSPVLQMSHW